MARPWRKHNERTRDQSLTNMSLAFFVVKGYLGLVVSSAGQDGFPTVTNHDGCGGACLAVHIAQG